jgi:hypothetical protein
MTGAVSRLFEGFKVAAHRTNGLISDLCAVNNRCERQSGAIPIFGNCVTPSATQNCTRAKQLFLGERPPMP